MSVASKILQVMGKVQYLKKDDKVAFGTTKYNFLSEEKVTTEIREAMREVGLVMIPVKSELIESGKLQTKSGESTKLLIKNTYKLIDADTGESELIEMMGEGADSGDKAMNKANTVAFKYVQRQTFMIATGDDPDKISSEEVLEGKKSDKNDDKKVTTAGNKVEYVDQQTVNTIIAFATRSPEIQHDVQGYMRVLKIKPDRIGLQQLNKAQGDELLDLCKAKARQVLGTDNLDEVSANGASQSA